MLVIQHIYRAREIVQGLWNVNYVLEISRWHQYLNILAYDLEKATLRQHVLEHNVKWNTITTQICKETDRSDVLCTIHIMLCKVTVILTQIHLLC